MADYGKPFEADRPTPSQRALRWFDFAHLPPGPGRSASMEFRPLAHKLERILPDGPEKTMALRKLLEAKDCAVRAAVEPGLDRAASSCHVWPDDERDFPTEFDATVSGRHCAHCGASARVTARSSACPGSEVLEQGGHYFLGGLMGCQYRGPVLIPDPGSVLVDERPTCGKQPWEHRLPGETSEQFASRMAAGPELIKIGGVYRMIEGAPGAIVRVVSMVGGQVEVVDQACDSGYSTVSSNLAPLGAEA